jgi:hypothetical protein
VGILLVPKLIFRSHGHPRASNSSIEDIWRQYLEVVEHEMWSCAVGGVESAQKFNKVRPHSSSATYQLNGGHNSRRASIFRPW